MTRPAAGWKEQAVVGFAGGSIATTTSVLRVEAGQHFPSDVIAGGCIGVAGGVTIPLLHRYVVAGERAPSPSRASWLAATAGMAAGTGVALLVNALAGP
jgi:membrane-associated phospholipid phosphatase